MEQVLELIMNADEEQMTQIQRAIIARHGALHPDWELTILALPKHAPQREQYIDRIAAMLKQETF